MKSSSNHRRLLIIGASFIVGVAVGVCSVLLIKDSGEEGEPSNPRGTTTCDCALPNRNAKVYAAPGDVVIVNVEIDPQLTLRIIVSHDGKMVVTRADPLAEPSVFDLDSGSSGDAEQMAKIWKAAKEACHLPSGSFFIKTSADVVGDMTIVRNGNVKKFRITDDSGDQKATQELIALWKALAYAIPW